VAIPGTPEQKKQLRKEMRRLLAEPGRPSAGVMEKVRTWLESHPELKTISTYSPLPGEIDITPLVTAFPHLRWVFPRVEESELVLHHVTDPATDLDSGAFNIREPKLHLPTLSFFEVDAFLCPGLAFDGYGGRLGRGRGFYDRMLEHARAGSLKIGVCGADQIVPDTFGEPHDVVMDQVISG
jgi:5-formyltetrahydrofolate cyclo-ligase